MNLRAQVVSIIAVLFLLISLIGSAVLIQQANQPLVIPTLSPSRTPPSTTSTIAPTTEAAIPTLAPTPTTIPLPFGLLIILAPPTNTALTDALQSALTQVLPTAAYSIQPLERIPTAFEVSNLVITWEVIDGQTWLYLIAPSSPALSSIHDAPQAWSIPASERIGIPVSDEFDLTFAAHTAAVVLSNDLAQSHIAALLPLASTPAHQAVIQFFKGQTASSNLLSLRAYSETIRLSDHPTAAYINRGNSYLALGDYNAAVTDYNTALSLEPDRIEARYNRILAYEQSGQLDLALTEALSLTEQYPTSAWLINAVGLIHYRNGSLEQARDYFQQASILAPTDSIPIFNEGITRHALGDYQGAVRAFDSALTLSPQAVTYYHQAISYHSATHIELAKSALNRALTLDPTYLDAYLLRGNLRRLAGERDWAYLDVEKALTLNPQDGRIYALIGDLKSDEHTWQDAIDAYSEAIDLGYAPPEIYAKRGWAWHQIRYIPYAVRDYEAALQLGSTDQQMIYHLGFALIDSGRYPEALDTLLGTVNQGNTTADAYAILAVALDATRRTEEADSAYQRAIILDPRYADPDYLRGLPLWSNISITRARVILTRLGY